MTDFWSLDLELVKDRAQEHSQHQAIQGWSCCRSHASASDVPGLVAEVAMLRQDLATALAEINRLRTDNRETGND